MKKISLILMILGLILTSTGVGFLLFKSFEEDKTKTLANMDKITAEYKNYSLYVDNFNEIRNYLYKDVFENIYFDTMEKNDSIIKQKFIEYEKNVDDIGKSTKILKKLCGNAYFPSSSVNTKCKSYGIAYEQIVNGFITDLNLYNSHIDKYNKYQLDNKLDKKLDKMVTNKKYIDFNNDKKYDGKEE